MTRFNANRTFVIGLGDCVPCRPFHQSDSLIECLAEIRMIWRDKAEQTVLLSLRLYFLPENTPKGRNGHGEVRKILQFPKFSGHEYIFSLKSGSVFDSPFDFV